MSLFFSVLSGENVAVPSKALQDLGVVHRLCFAAKSIPMDAPQYWELVRDFSIQDVSGYLLPANDCHIFVENLHLLGEDIPAVEMNVL